MHAHTEHFSKIAINTSLVGLFNSLQNILPFHEEISIWQYSSNNNLKGRDKCCTKQSCSKMY